MNNIHDAHTIKTEEQRHCGHNCWTQLTTSEAEAMVHRMIPNVINTTEKYLLGLYLHIPGKKKIKNKSHQEWKTSTKVKLLCIKYKHKIAILEEKKKKKNRVP